MADNERQLAQEARARMLNDPPEVDPFSDVPFEDEDVKPTPHETYDAYAKNDGEPPSPEPEQEVTVEAQITPFGIVFAILVPWDAVRTVQPPPEPPAPTVSGGERHG